MQGAILSLVTKKKDKCGGVRTRCYVACETQTSRHVSRLNFNRYNRNATYKQKEGSRKSVKRFRNVIANGEDRQKDEKERK